MKKPPIGLKPRKIHEQARIREILQAMLRYNEASTAIPSEWIEELSELCMRSEDLEEAMRRDICGTMQETTVRKDGTRVITTYYR